RRLHAQTIAIRLEPQELEHRVVAQEQRPQSPRRHTEDQPAPPAHAFGRGHPIAKQTLTRETNSNVLHDRVLAGAGPDALAAGCDCDRRPEKDFKPRNWASSPRISSMRSSWLYLAIRSLREAEPVLIWPQFVATARSAIVVSSVSPERCETTLAYEAERAISIVSSVSVKVPI